MFSQKIIIFLLLGISALLSGCNSAGCNENRNAVPLAAFFSSADDRGITLDSLQIYGIGAPADTVLSEVGTPLSQIYLPMRPTHQSVSWCFAYKWKSLDTPALYDTIAIDYTSTPFFASEECGAYYKYKIDRLDVTSHLIDSVAIVDSLVTNVDWVYLNIYFRTAEQEQ